MQSSVVPKQPEPKPKRKLTDAERVLDMIHCIDEEDEKKNAAAAKAFMKPDLGNKPPNMRIPHYGGAFEGVTGGPKTYRQTFSYQMVRKPEGTFATTTVVDPSGNTKTIIKRTIDGETKTQTLVNGVEIDDANGAGNMLQATKPSNNWIIDCGRHFYVNKDGYALPKNLFWLEIWQLSIKRIASIQYNYSSNNHYQALVVVVILFLCLTKRNQVINTSATLTSAAAVKTQKMKKNPNDSTAVNSTSSKTVHVKYAQHSEWEADSHAANFCTFIHVIIVTKIRWKQLFIKFYFLKFDYDYLKFNQCYDFR